MSNEFTENDLGDEYIEKLDLIVREYGYSSREEAIKYLITEQINKGMGAMTGGAKLRQSLGLQNVVRKDGKGGGFNENHE